MLPFRTIFVGTIILFLALVAGPYVAVQFNYLAPDFSLSWLRYFGIFLILAGLPLAFWCAFLLLLPGHENIPYAPLLEFKIIGPYKYVRNPFMIGCLLTLWGEAIFLQSVPLFVYAGVLTLCVHFWVLGFEEPSLEDRYGDEYRRYKEKVPRWLPMRIIK